MESCIHSLNIESVLRYTPYRIFVEYQAGIRVHWQEDQHYPVIIAYPNQSPILHAMEIVNRKAKYEYEFLQTMEAGMQLTGTEVKSLRNGDANMGDAWCLFEQGELYIKNLHIGEYKHASNEQHAPLRMRKLLLHKAELRKLERRATEKGLTIVPYRIFFSESGYAKCEIALARGKKSFDKRESIKEKDVQRDLDRTKVKR